MYPPVILTASGQQFRLGRTRPVARCPRMRLGNYLTRSALPTPPDSVDYMTKAAPALKQVYLNDQLGDCVIAGIAHLEGVFTGNNGEDPAVVFSNHRIQRLYGKIGGYVPGNSTTDRGCNEQDALNFWQRYGAMPDQEDAHKIAGWLAIDGNKPDQVRTALYLFENVMFGVELPDAWLRSPAPGFVWDVSGEANPNNGHCFVSAAYEKGRLKVSTWGMEGWITDEAVEAYATTAGQGELYTALSPNAISRAAKKAPNGLDWAQLLADMTAMR